MFDHVSRRSVIEPGKSCQIFREINELRKYFGLTKIGHGTYQGSNS